MAGDPHYLNDDQRAQLLRPIHPRRVNKDGKGYSHVEAYEIRAHLSRIFGIARWSCQVEKMELVFERPTKTKAGKDATEVCYRASATLSVRSPTGAVLAVYTEWATGAATNPDLGDAHDMAVKTAESQALKRCASNLGDQFGLSLYNGGSMAPLVIRTLEQGVITAPDLEAEAVCDGVEGVVGTLTPEGDAAPREYEREVSTVPPPAALPSPAAPPDTVPAGEVLPVEDLTDEQAAADNVREMFPGASEVDEPQTVAEISAMVTRSRQLPTEDRLQMLKEALEMAVKTGVRQHRLVNGVTVGAALTREIAEASSGA